MKLKSIVGYEGYYISEKGNMFKKMKLGANKKLIKITKLPVKPVKIKKKSMAEHPFVNWKGEEIIVKCYPQLYHELMEMKKRQTQKLDNVITTHGPVGGGKSTLAHSTLGPIMDKNFTIDNIYFSGHDLIEASKTKPDGSCLILDESEKDAAGIRAQSPAHKELVAFLTTCRSRMFTIILIMPEFFKMSSYIALNRSNLMVYTYLQPKTYKRGQGLLWDKQLKRNLYLKGKKDLNYHCSRANYNFRFYKNNDAIDVDTYEKEKLAFFSAKTKEKVTPKQEYEKRDDLIFNLYENEGMSQTKIAEMTNLDRTTINKILKRAQKSQKSECV